MIFYIVLCFVLVACVSAGPNCDLDATIHKEGILGETKSFPWLGVLRVHIHKGPNLSVAATGLLLVQRSHAIASADEVSKVPKNYLKGDSRAMFIIKDREQYYCGVKDYVLHPDYQFATINTIALVMLDPDKSSIIPPICWHRNFDLSSKVQRYAVGYTDQNKLLQKVIYKMDHVNKTLCDEFYNRAGFKAVASTVEEDTQTYICGFARSNKRHCEWDNGMVLVTNSTGQWRLIGFGIHGPGCSAPARFIYMPSYQEWIRENIANSPIDF